ncbi:MAG: GNAT family N-acetyltransferase, partial [Chloroflexota bacterium]
MALARKPTEHVRIRSAVTRDRGDMLHANRRAWEISYAHIFSPHEVRGLFQNLLPQRGSWVFQRDRRIATIVAEVNKRVVGFIGVGTLLNKSEGEVTTFYILPEYHGRGIGTRLWHAGLEELERVGCTGAWVWVLAKAEARHFYTSRGCVERQRGTICAT